MRAQTPEALTLLQLIQGIGVDEDSSSSSSFLRKDALYLLYLTSTVLNINDEIALNQVFIEGAGTSNFTAILRGSILSSEERANEVIEAHTDDAFLAIALGLRHKASFHILRELLLPLQTKRTKDDGDDVIVQKTSYSKSEMEEAFPNRVTFVNSDKESAIFGGGETLRLRLEVDRLERSLQEAEKASDQSRIEAISADLERQLKLLKGSSGDLSTA